MAQAIKGLSAYPNSQVCKGCHITEAMCAIPLLPGWVAQRVQNFCCTLLKNAERNAKLKGLDGDSGH